MGERTSMATVGVWRSRAIVRPKDFLPFVNPNLSIFYPIGKPVAYLLAVDIVLGLPPSRLRRLTQPVKSPPNWLSTSRLLCLACL
jgi:hypothetical protein